MKLYRRLIKPVLYYPGQSYEPKKKDLEDPAVWYPEEEHDAILERFKNLNNTFNTVGFDEQYIEYTCNNSNCELSEEYFSTDNEMITWLNEFAARQSNFEDAFRLTEISLKMKVRFAIEKKHIKLNSPEKCGDCKSLAKFGRFNFCHMASISPDNPQQDISSIYVDPEDKPEWCPIDRTNMMLDELDPDKREKADMIMKGLSAFFGSDGMLSGEKAGDNKK